MGTEMDRRGRTVGDGQAGTETDRWRQTGGEGQMETETDGGLPAALFPLPPSSPAWTRARADGEAGGRSLAARAPLTSQRTGTVVSRMLISRDS